MIIYKNNNIIVKIKLYKFVFKIFNSVFIALLSWLKKC